MDITTSYNNRCFLIPRADFVTEGQEELIKEIFKKHGENLILKIKLIDENDDYDSFYVETGSNSFCLKISFDNIPIFYEHMILTGIEHMGISPQAVERNEIQFSKKIYYTIQTFEFSENLLNIGNSSIITDNNDNFNKILNKMHLYEPPEYTFEHLDDTKSYLEYQNVNFDNILNFVEEKETEEYLFLKKIHTDIFNEMIFIFNENQKKLTLKKLVHGNLDSSTIISNNNKFKFINFENAFIGSPFFDLVNLTFELQVNGLNELYYISERIKNMGLSQSHLKSGNYINEYKICKKIWTRKKALDLIKEYTKEVIVLNKTRIDKMARLGHEFSYHFYRFMEINSFQENKDIFVSKFSNLILDN